MRRRYSVVLFLSGFFVLNSLCKGITGDFSQEDLLRPLPFQADKEERSDPENLSSLLKQTYRYLGKGKQAYVFLSEDRSHVLKVFKPYFPPLTFHIAGKPCKIGPAKLPFAKAVFGALRKEETERRKLEEFISYENSFRLLRKETRITYLHLQETDHLRTSIVFYDKIGILRTMDADTSCFLIQEKTEMLYPELERMIRSGQTDKAKALIDSFVNLSFVFLSRGIDNPTTVDKNFGCIGTEAIQIDAGRVLISEDFIRNGPDYRGIEHCVHRMKKWLGSRSEELSSYLDLSVENHQRLYTKESHASTL